MNGLRRGYRRPETGYYRELFLRKYLKVRAERDWLGGIKWVHDDQPEPDSKPKREPLSPGISLLILLLVIIACFALAIICALPLKLLTY